MGSRIDLNKKLQDILGSGNVYYNPDASLTLKYPCFLYSLSNTDTFYADGIRYTDYRNYTVTYITRKADDEPLKKMFDSFAFCRFERSYKADGLYHYVFNVYISSY